MNQKKIICIFLTAVFLLTAVSGAVAQQRENEVRLNIFDKEIKDTGTVKETNFKDFYVIETDNNIEIMGLTFNKIYPINLEKDFEQDGIRVRFTATLSRIISFRERIICIYLKALPVELKQIEPIEEPKESIIHGRVTDAETGEPIGNANITAKRINSVDSEIYTTLSGRGGFYELKVLSGDYLMSASKDGYREESKEISIEPEETIEVNFTLKPMETVVLILDALQFEFLPQDLFSLIPEPIDILPSLDGKLHAVYENGTEVEISVKKEHENYLFDYWILSEDVKRYDNPLTVVMDEDKHIIAVFKDSTYTPEVETLPAKRGLLRITLKGLIVDDGGEPCEAFFEIKRSDEIIRTVEVPGMYRTGDEFSIKVYIPGNLIGPQIYYRACASNSAGTVKGEFEPI